jgi:hypothetical protein
MTTDDAGDRADFRVCIVGLWKLGQYMGWHALDGGYEVGRGVSGTYRGQARRGQRGRMTVGAGATDDREVVKRAVAGCDGVLTVLVPRGVSPLPEK